MGRPGIPIQVRREFWQQIRTGLPIFKAAQVVGVPITTARDWFRQAGGVNPYPPKPVSGRYLSFEEREEVAVGLAAGRSQAEIARDLGRDPSTICREIARNSTSARSHKASAGPRYRASFAQYQADQQARRPKSCRLAGHTRLRDEVQAVLKKHWSPEQIVSRLIVDFPSEEGMRVSHETIY
jgi:IS30 family transposase